MQYVLFHAGRIKPQVIFLIDANPNLTLSKTHIPIVPFDDLYRSPITNSQRPVFPQVHIDPKVDPVLMPYSSGTTGLPKGVILTHYNLLCLLYGRPSNGIFRTIEQGDAAVLFLPFFHMAGFMGLIIALHHGARGIIMRQFDAGRYLDTIQRCKVSVVYVVPTVLVFLAKDPSVDKYDLSSVTILVFGAAPAGKELIEAVAKRFPNLESIVQVGCLLLLFF